MGRKLIRTMSRLSKLKPPLRSWTAAQIARQILYFSVPLVFAYKLGERSADLSRPVRQAEEAAVLMENKLKKLDVQLQKIREDGW